MVDNAYASSTFTEPVNSFGTTKVRTAANHDYQQLLDDGLSQKQVDLIMKEDKYTAHTYTHVPVVLSKGEGVYVYDADGTKYLDYLSAYFSVNQGHCHPRILAAAHKQLDIMTMASRAFFNDQLGSYAEYMCGVFGYDKLLPMNTGVEGGETAVKLARRWGYQVKHIAENQARVVFARGNYWGRSFAALSSSADPSSYTGYGPYLPNLDLIPYNDLNALEQHFEQYGKDIAAFMVEPIQGNAGVVVPTDDYMPGVRALCDKHNVLLICDEVQTGLGRTGRLIACDRWNVKPDILVLGKALSGGLMPVSCVLANDNVMLQIHRGEHGSTFGGNPLGCAIAREAIQVLLDEKLPENAEAMGQVFRQRMLELRDKFNGAVIKGVRGHGLLNAVMFQSTESRKDVAYDFCVALRNKGLLARHSSPTLIVFAPPLIINAEQMQKGLEIIEEVASQFAQEQKSGDKSPVESKQQN